MATEERHCHSEAPSNSYAVTTDAYDDDAERLLSKWDKLKQREDRVTRTREDPQAPSSSDRTEQGTSSP